VWGNDEDVARSAAEQLSGDGPQKSIGGSGEASGPEHEQIGLGHLQYLLHDATWRAVLDV
jgi:hypothetical protein